jgi:2-C-methyl-D-erythritol 4-phosphate cytidylyltransferase
MERVIPGLGLVVAAGGSGQRFGRGRNKLLVRWRGLALFCHSLATFLPLLRPGRIVIAAPPHLHPRFRRELQRAGLPEAIRLVAGGATRQESVAHGVRALPAAVTLVAVQDGARPCTAAALLAACAESARRRGSGVAARRVTDTIKLVEADGRVSGTPPRERLFAAETPQVFRRALLERGLAAAAAAGLTVTDDAQAVEAIGSPVYLVVHDGENPKITFPGDLRRLQAWRPPRRRGTAPRPGPAAHRPSTDA